MSQKQPALDRSDERVRHAETLGDSLRAFFDRVRSGDLGMLPVIVGLIVISVVFTLLNLVMRGEVVPTLLLLPLVLLPLAVAALGVCWLLSSLAAITTPPLALSCAMRGPKVANHSSSMGLTVLGEPRPMVWRRSLSVPMSRKAQI